MRIIILLTMVSLSLLLNACDNVNLVPAQGQTTNNGIQGYHVK